MSTAQAAGFALIEQNASGLGNAYAGQAAAAQDASTIYFNPAGLTEIKGRQFLGALHFIKPSAEFTSSTGVSSGGDAGSLAAVPSLYYTMDLGKDLKFGLGINSPFGLKTEYDHPWGPLFLGVPTGSVHGIKSDLKTINLNPTLAWQVNEKVSLGIGIDFQYLQAELTSFNPTLLGGQVVSVKGDDTGWGFNLGAMFKLDEASRIGLSYRSRIDFTLDGDMKIPAATLAHVTADATMPDTASVAYFRQLNDRWSIKADLTWTGWDAFDRLTVVDKATDTPVASTDYAWKSVWRAGLGVDYRADDRWTWRFGTAYDNSPVLDSAHRTPGIPDADRLWLALGGQYRLHDGGAIDFGYAHLFVHEAAIDKTTPIPLSGSFDNAVDILSVQYTHSF
jgi:long-chain fatty acid transport protein